MTTAGDLDFDRDGALLFGGVLNRAEAASLAERLEPQITGRPGVRLQVEPDIIALLAASVAVGRVAAKLIGPDAAPVRGSVRQEPRRQPDRRLAPGPDHSRSRTP